MPQAHETARESQRSEIIERAADVAERTGHHHDDLRPFLARYYRHVPLEDLAERDPLDLAGAALSHKQLAAHRPQGSANVRVFTPTVDEYGWASGHTVVEIVTDDMPFLVDSVMAELSRQERGIHLVVHPQVVVRRDVTGRTLPAAPDRREGPFRGCGQRFVHSSAGRWVRPQAARRVGPRSRTRR